MRLQDLIEDMQSADASGHEVIFWEEQFRGSPAAYTIDGWDFVEIDDDDAEPDTETCPDCSGEGVVENPEIETDPEADGEIPCDECGGDGEVESDETPKKTVLAVQINHDGYAPGGLRDR